MKKTPKKVTKRPTKPWTGWAIVGNGRLQANYVGRPFLYHSKKDADLDLMAGERVVRVRLEVVS